MFYMLWNRFKKDVADLQNFFFPPKIQMGFRMVDESKNCSRILMVNGDKEFRSSLNNYIATIGYRVVEADSCPAAGDIF